MQLMSFPRDPSELSGLIVKATSERDFVEITVKDGERVRVFAISGRIRCPASVPYVVVEEIVNVEFDQEWNDYVRLRDKFEKGVAR